ncbi:Immune inhibitor A peptidase M6 [Fragilaria crotonensis]|nr:Immune inhibitor A peptidase M6 [Fragilaria crotonensis]
MILESTLNNSHLTACVDQFLHSGYSAENGEKDCYNDREPEQRIWSHASSHASKWKSKDEYSFDFYIIASFMRGACGSERTNIGVVTHELIHSWGVPDLYDTGSVGKGTGHMSGPYGWDGMQTHPFYMSPCTRMKSGFLEPIEI